jgi:hypothetical protein
MKKVFVHAFNQKKIKSLKASGGGREKLGVRGRG